MPSKLNDAAAAIIYQRDHHAEAGKYDATTLRPKRGQCFDDWAADILEQALEADESPIEQLRRRALKLRADAITLDTGMDPDLVRELDASADELDSQAQERAVEVTENALYRLKEREHMTPEQVRAVDDFMGGVGAVALADLFELIRYHEGPQA